jgi:hypothetical protein
MKAATPPSERIRMLGSWTTNMDCSGHKKPAAAAFSNICSGRRDVAVRSEQQSACHARLRLLRSCSWRLCGSQRVNIFQNLIMVLKKSQPLGCTPSAVLTSGADPSGWQMLRSDDDSNLCHCVTCRLKNAAVMPIDICLTSGLWDHASFSLICVAEVRTAAKYACTSNVLYVSFHCNYVAVMRADCIDALNSDRNLRIDQHATFR